MIIQCENLKKTFQVAHKEEGLLASVRHLFNTQYDTKTAVKNFSCQIKRGEIVGLLGPNGAGKSTTIKMMTGILKPSGGSVSVLGYDPYEERKQYVKHIGALFGQKNQLWWDLPASDSFRLSQKLYTIPDDVFTARKQKLISLLDAESIVENPVRNLSLGERMKCEFIMALLHNPEIVYLDEPTIGVDVFTKLQIRNFITSINEEFNTTIIITTHDMDDIEALAERVVVISEGRKVFDDTFNCLKQVLGDTKRITLLTEGDVSFDRWGIEVLEMKGTEYKLCLHTEECSVETFLTHVSSQSRILDMEISGPTVEEIIKVVYTN